MIYVMSGGNNLNFKIVNGTTQPSNPKENTIWVNTGYVIHAYDFSATEPTLRSKNRNLIPYNYAKTRTYNGLTFTVNGDGSITVNGTATALTSFMVWGDADNILLPAGTYTLSGCPGGGNLTSGYCLCTNNVGIAADIGSGKTFTLSAPKYVSFKIRIAKDAVVNNAVFKPQLEKGSAATSFVKGDATGQVWIQTGSVSNGAFNALKKNGIMVYPVKAKLYQNGAWKDKDAQVYQNGAWKDFWNGELYDAGNTFDAVTGGWTASGVTIGSGWTPKAPTVTYNADSMTVVMGRSGAAQCGVLHTANKMDLTNVNQIVFNGSVTFSGSDTNRAGLVVMSSVSTTAYDVAAAKYALADGDALDVSGLSGSYYVALYASTLSGDPRDTTIVCNKLQLV